MKNKLIKRILTIVLFVASTQTINAQEKNESYRVETIPMPEGLTSETGAVEFLPDGRLVACFTRGEVMTYEPSTKKWKLFAEGLHDPLGILVVSNSELLIIQRPELTRVKDTDGGKNRKEIQKSPK